MSIFGKYIAYVKDNPEGYWFKRKVFGWGWVPATKEGWAVTLAYIAALFLFAATIDDSSPPREVAFTFVLPVAILTAALLRVIYTKGEKPKWQWGLPEKKEDKDEKAG